MTRRPSIRKLRRAQVKRERAFIRKVRPKLDAIDHWIIQYIHRIWDKDPDDVQKAIANLHIPYKTALEKTLKGALVDTWRTGQEDAERIVRQAKRHNLRRWQRRMTTQIHELVADLDRYTYIAAEYQTWAEQLGGEIWEKKIKAISGTTTRGLRDGWGLRNQHGYRTTAGVKVSAFEAHGGRGPQFVQPGYTRVIENPGIMDQLAPQLADHRGYQLDRIARTETTRAYNEGMRSIYNEDESVVGYEFIAIWDSRTTDVCLMMNGTLFAKDDPRVESYTPPLHVSCRSMISPVFVWDEVAMNLDQSKTMTLEDKRGEKYDLTFKPNRVRPMEGFEGRLSVTGLGRTNLMTVAQAEAQRGGFVPITPAQAVGKFLHPRSSRLAKEVAAKVAAEALAKGVQPPPPGAN